MIQHLTKDPHDSDISYIQSRAEMNYETIDEYAAMMESGTVFDEVSAFIEKGKHIYIYNGAHRLEAARKVSKPLLIMLRPGTKANAEWLALSANTKHGLRRSTADKQRVTKNALLHPNAATLSDREIARHCQVDHKTVGKIRADLVTSGEIPQIAEKTVTRNGTEYQQAAKAEPAYAAVWQLEEGVKSWLEKALHSANATKISVLTEIKKKTASGKRNLERLITGDIILPSPRRKRDVVQAVNNVLDQLQQAAKAEPEYVNISQLEQSIWAWLNKEWPDSPADQWAALHNIKKQRTTTNPFLNGPALLEKLQVGSILPGPRNKGDVRQACNNILDQMNQAQKWQQKRNEHTATLTCPNCGEQTIEAIDGNAIRCTTCDDEWNCVADFEREAKEYQKTDPHIFCSKCTATDPGDADWHYRGIQRLCKACAENEARAAEIKTKLKKYATEIERKNAEATARIKAYKDQVAAEVTKPACSVHRYSTEALINQYQSICPDCLRALGKAMIKAAKEIEIQN